MAAMEMTVVSTAMPTVVAELGGALHYAWVFTAYMLTSTVTVPIYGKLADLHGRKPVMLVAMGLFLAGSMASGQARSMDQLIFFRALQGIGAGGMQPMALTIVGDIFKIEERGKMQGLFGAVWAIAGLVGPLLGGVIVASLSWRWVFYVNVPFGLVSAVVLSASLVEDIERRKHALDILGALTLAGAVVTLLLGTDGVEPRLLLPVSVMLTALFLFVETRAKEPLLPLRLFRTKVLGTSSLLSAFSGGSMVGFVTFVPLYAQGVLGASPAAAGSTIAGMAVTWPIASAIAGRLITRVGFRALVRTGFLVVAVSATAAVLTMSRGASLGTLRLCAAGFGLGMGIANTPLVIAVQSSVGFSERGVVTASTMFFRNIGATVAVGAMGVVLSRTLLRSAAAQAEGTSLVARMLGPERRGIEEHVLRALATDLSLGIGRAMWLATLLALGAALTAWAFPVVKAQK
jgi:EmrB/QacA subfamily drug resistance transporter